MSEKNRIHVYLDGDDKPLVSYRPPVRFELDTTQLKDGPHTLKVVASDANGQEGVRVIPFEVRNGPGIDVEGLKEHDILEGKMPILLNAYGGAKEPLWEPDRAETPAPVPTWAWLLLLVVVAWSAFYIAHQWNPPEQYASTPTYGQFSEGHNKAEVAASTSPPPAESAGTSSMAKKAAQLYSSHCASCHQANGKGVPGAFPPLADDPVVMAKDPTQHIKIVLFGAQGETIDGTKYTSPMPPWSEQLSDDEVAAIVNHERTSWGNDAPTVTSAEVKKVREKGK